MSARWLLPLLLLAAAPAQADPAARLEAARARQAAGESEAAAAELRALRTALDEVADAGKRKTLATAVDALLAKVDPDDAAAQRQLEAAARDLLKAAQGYARRKWLRMALPWCELADALAPKVAASALAEARAGGSAADAMTTWFADGKSLVGPGKWTVADGTVLSPRLTRESEGFRSIKQTPNEYRIDVAVRAAAEPAKVGFVFGLHYRESDGGDYFIEELRHLQCGSQLRLLHVSGQQVDELLNVPVQLTRAERAGWLDLWVEARRDRVAIGIGHIERAEVPVKQDLAGCIGFYVSGDSPYREPIAARDLRVRTL
jgi:hypothetical protein